MRACLRPALLNAVLLLPLLLAGPCLGAEPQQPAAPTASTLIITEENDYFAGTDNHYTNGIKLSWVSGDLKKYAEDERLPEFVLPYLGILPFVNEPGQQYNVALSAGQNMYVPRDTHSGALQPDDRPFAGWSYISLALHAKTSTQLDSFETSVGVVGPSSLAEETQNNYHALMGFERVRGWGHQLHDEPGIVLSWQRTLRAARAEFGNDLAWDFLPHIRATVGNVQTHAAAGFETRFGYRLPWDFGTSLIQPGGGVSAPADAEDPRLRPDTDFGLHLFAGAEGRAVARNIFLDGNTWESSAHVPKHTFVADVMGGIGLVMGRAKLTYTQVYRTEEYYGQKSGQMFGSVSLSITF